MSDVRPVTISTLNSAIEEIDYKSFNSIENADVYTAINTIASDISSLPIKVTDDKFNSNLEMEYLLNVQPNDILNGKDFMYVMVVSAILNGNAYAYIERNEFEVPVKLHFIPNDRIKAIKKKSNNSYTTQLEYEVINIGSTKTTKRSSEDMIHFKPFSVDGIIGQSPLIALKDDVEAANNSKRFFNNFFKHGTQSGGIIRVAGDLNSEDKDEIRKAWQAANSGTANSHKIIVLDESTTYDPIKVDADILKLINESKHSTTQVAKVLGLPLHKMKIDTPSLSLEQANSDYVVNTLNSYINTIESEFNRKLFGDKDMRITNQVTLDTDVYKFADAKSKHESVKAKYELGIISLNESRKALGHPPIANGDRYIQSLNYMNSELIDEYQLLKANANPNIDTFLDNNTDSSKDGE